MNNLHLISHTKNEKYHMIVTVSEMFKGERGQIPRLQIFPESNLKNVHQNFAWVKRKCTMLNINELAVYLLSYSIELYKYTLNMSTILQFSMLMQFDFESFIRF